MRHHILGSNNVVVCSNTPSAPYFSVTADPDTSVSHGSVRYNPNSNALEVLTGTMWMVLPDTHTTVNLSPEVDGILMWARKKMAQEAELEHLMSKYPTLRNAHDQFQLVKHLVAEEKNNT
jgi:hypothetical protein